MNKQATEGEPVSTLTFNEFQKSKDAQDLVKLYQNTTLFCHSRVFPGKIYPFMLELDETGLKLLYHTKLLFKGWAETGVDGKAQIPVAVVEHFVKEAKIIARQFYAKIDYLSSLGDE